MAKPSSRSVYSIRRNLMVKDRVLELLEAADWNDIILKLTYFAIWLSCRYTWKSGDPRRLPKGKTPEDIALDAIAKVWNGTRDWDINKYPDLLTHLKWIVKSEIKNLYSSMEHQKTSRMPVMKNDEDTELDCDQIAHDPFSPTHEMTSTPEEDLITKEDMEFEEKLKAELYTAVKGDEDLEQLLLCFEYGFCKAEEIANQTGWDVKKVYNIKRKLLRKAAKIGKTQ
jgi:hypothetical protein